MAITTATIAYLLKNMYPQKRLQDLVYKDNPLLALMPKGTGIGGKVTAIGLKYGDTVAQSADFATAQALAGSESNKGVQFLLTRVKDYQIYQIETEAMLAAEDDMEAFARTLDDTVSGALNNFGRARGIDLYRDGVGERGQVSGITGAGPYTWTLTNPNDITNFEVGRVLVVSTGATKTANLRNSGGGVAIATIDRDAGTFTTQTNPDSAAGNDWIFFKGDRQVAYTAARRLSGLEAWNPASAPGGSDSFFGVNRSADATRLAGQRIDISTLLPEEGLVTAIHRVGREGGNPKHLFLNNVDAKNIHLSLGAKAITEYTQVGGIGFSTIRVTGPKGDFNVYADQNAPSGVGRLLQLDTWKLRYLRKLAFVQDLDGASMLRVYNDDAYEGRIAFFGNLSCEAPGWNARLVMPT